MPTIWNQTVPNNDSTYLIGVWWGLSEAVYAKPLPGFQHIVSTWWWEQWAFKYTYMCLRSHSKCQSINLTLSAVNTQNNIGSKLKGVWVQAW